jgi:hypothetical protein
VRACGRRRGNSGQHGKRRWAWIKPVARSASDRRRLWDETVGGTDCGHGDSGRHDSVIADRQTGGEETGAGWSDCGGGAVRPRDLV